MNLSEVMVTGPVVDYGVVGLVPKVEFRAFDYDPAIEIIMLESLHKDIVFIFEVFFALPIALDDGLQAGEAEVGTAMTLDM